MARKTVYVDDLDGSEIQEGQGGPVQLAVRGEYYEIDLSEKNQAKLDKLLEPYLTKATKVPAPSFNGNVRAAKATTRTKVPGQGKDYLDSVRKWARANGHTVADRGRIAASIVTAYEEAKES